MTVIMLEFYLQDSRTNKLLNIKGGEKFIKIMTVVASFSFP